MSFFSIFGHPKRAPDWSYTSPDKIWRILVADGGRIVGETRNQETKQVSFFCLDDSTGRVVWERLTVEEPWWVGIDFVQQDVLLLHEFRKPDLPEHMGIRAHDIESGRPLWHNRELTFWFAYRDSVYAFKTLFERRVGYALDLHTGNIREEYDSGFEELYSLRNLAIGEQQTDYRFPETFDPEVADPLVASAIKKIVEHDKVLGDVEYLRERDIVLLNYHRPEKGSTVESVSLENRFIVVEVGKDERLFSDVLARGAKAPVPDSFFVKGGFAYFIKDQQTLSALRLWKS